MVDPPPGVTGPALPRDRQECPPSVRNLRSSAPSAVYPLHTHSSSLRFFAIFRLHGLRRDKSREVIGRKVSGGLCSFVEDGEILVVDEQPITALSSDLPGDPSLDQKFHGRGCGGERERRPVADFG